MDIHQISSMASTAVALPFTFIILVRLIPNKVARQRYHLFLMAQCVFDIIFSACNVLRTFGVPYALPLQITRYMVPLTALMSTLSAITWKCLFTKNNKLDIGLWAVSLGLFTPIMFIMFVAHLKEGFQLGVAWLNRLIYNFVLLWGLLMGTFICQTAIVPICLFEVLRLPSSFFSRQTTKGYQKVAIGLILKIVAQIMLVLYLLLSLYYYSISTAVIEKWDVVITGLLVIGMIYPGTDVLINFYMVSGLVLKIRKSSVVQLVANISSSNHHVHHT